jgi:hypothetical protein
MNSKAKISATSRDCLVQKVRLFCIEIEIERERERERQRESLFLDRIKLLLFLAVRVSFSASSMRSGHSGKGSPYID